MADQSLIIVNPTGTAYSNVNAGGDDIPAYSSGTAAAPGAAVTLSDAEQATFMAAHPEALLMGASASDEQQRLAAKILKLGGNPGTRTS